MVLAAHDAWTLRRNGKTINWEPDDFIPTCCDVISYFTNDLQNMVNHIAKCEDGKAKIMNASDEQWKKLLNDALEFESDSDKFIESKGLNHDWHVLKALAIGYRMGKEVISASDAEAAADTEPDKIKERQEKNETNTNESD